ncbi:DMT family transporter [Maritalea mediterranea]|uniref:DMT family transporter n=1 Tax=Maritalea mediterranea TaxID=2909667 RepID=A0ABS9E7G6_9HYPH|nr:DMT family transporter [Maritalea mediterranea]MCF4098817.1 DMT family transporter [Maritalea mediterranea]
MTNLSQNPTINLGASPMRRFWHQFDFGMLLLLLIVGFFLGVTAVLGKVAINTGWTPTIYLAHTTLGGGLLMLAGTSLFGQRARFDAGVWRYNFMSGLLFVVPNLMFFFAVRYVGAGFIAFATAFAPVLTFFVAVAIGDDRFSLGKIFGVAMALLGAMLLAFGKLTDTSIAPLWIIVSLMGPVFLALGNIFRSRFWPKDAAPLALAPWMLIMAGLYSYLFALLTGELSHETVSKAGLVVMGAQMLCFAAGFGFYFVLQKRGGPVYLSQIGPVIALVGAILAATFLREDLTLMVVLGGAAVIAGVVIFNGANFGRKG